MQNWLNNSEPLTSHQKLRVWPKDNIPHFICHSCTRLSAHLNLIMRGLSQVPSLTWYCYRCDCGFGCCLHRTLIVLMLLLLMLLLCCFIFFQLCASRAGNDRYVQRGMQTINPALKLKGAQTVPVMMEVQYTYSTLTCTSSMMADHCDHRLPTFLGLALHEQEHASIRL